MVEVKLLELSVDCKAAEGWDTRISHLKVSYDQVHKISSSPVLGILYFHKLPLFWWVMRSNHLHFVSQRLKDKESLKISCEFVSGHHQPMFFTLIILWVWAWSPPNVHCWLTAWEKREQGRFSNHGQMTLWKDSERKGVWGQYIIIAVTEIPKHWFNSKWVLLVLQGLFRVSRQMPWKTNAL